MGYVGGWSHWVGGANGWAEHEDGWMGLGRDSQSTWPITSV